MRSTASCCISWRSRSVDFGNINWQDSRVAWNTDGRHTRGMFLQCAMIGVRDQTSIFIGGRGDHGCYRRRGKRRGRSWSQPGSIGSKRVAQVTLVLLTGRKAAWTLKPERTHAWWLHHTRKKFRPPSRGQGEGTRSKPMRLLLRLSISTALDDTFSPIVIVVLW